jgi:hypothetical protein
MGVRWAQRFPGRLEWELADFGRRGLSDFTLDKSEFAHGRVVLTGSATWKDKEIPLRIAYPDLFPYFRPEVYAPSLTLGRHQNPYDHNLCLLEAPTRAWATTESAAWLVAERLPFLLGLIESGGKELAENEVPQGEPDSFYIPRELGTAVFIDEGSLSLPASARCGTAYFSFSADRVGPGLHILLRQLNDRSPNGGGKPLAVAGDRLRERFPGPNFEGRWVRLDRAPGREPDDYFRLADQMQPGFGTPPWQQIGNARISVLGVVFTEETGQNMFADGWLFAVRYETGVPRTRGAYVTKGEPFAPGDLFARVPRLRPLSQRAVAQFGLGSLGAPLALELGRAQIGDLRLLDHDIVTGGTIVRWPIGLPAVGSAKTHVIEATIKSHYPYTSCRSATRHLGAAPASSTEQGQNDFEVVDDLLEGADLVVDATAEVAIQQLVSDVATSHNVPQLFLWGTEGGYGGMVARIQPGQTGCWFCLQLAIDDHSIPAPPRESTGTTQPRGCGLPTFTGESFNQLPIIAQATRTAVAILLGELDIGEDVFVLSLRDGDHPASSPIWTAHALDTHPQCPHCSPPL